MIYEKRLLLYDIKSIAEHLATSFYLTDYYMWYMNNVIRQMRNQGLTMSESFRIIARYVKKYEGGKNEQTL